MPSDPDSHQDERIALLRALTDLLAPSGYEAVVQTYLEDRWRSSVERAWIDTAGNLVADVGGNGPRIAIVAHSDEISLSIRDVRPDGFLAVVGGQRHARESARDYAIATGHVVVVVTERGSVPGVLAAGTGHLLGRGDKAVAWDDMFVDIGTDSREEAMDRGVRPGCPVVWAPPLQRIGQNIVGKSMDNRVGILVQDDLLRSVALTDLRTRLHLVSTAREEYGLAGASALDRALTVDAAIVLEVGPSGDTPAGSGDSTAVALGEGPILVHKDGGDAGTRYDRRITNALEDVATEANIRVQHAVFGRYGTDGGALMRRGIPTAVVAVPTRYTHSPIETIRMTDVAATIRLLRSALTSPAFAEAIVG